MERKLLNKTGAPEYVPSDEDIQLVSELSKHGISRKLIAEKLGVSEKTLLNISNRNEEFLRTLRASDLKYFLECTEKVDKGLFPVPLYIYYSKTKWRNFYPQEQKEVPKEEHSITVILSEPSSQKESS